MQPAPMTELDTHSDFDAVMAELMGVYPDFALSDVQEMRRHAATIAAEMPCDAAIAAIRAIAHNVKGQGASFGYDLMTICGETICTTLRGRTMLTRDGLLQLNAQISACEEILGHRLTGLGGARGEALLSRMASLSRS